MIRRLLVIVLFGLVLFAVVAYARGYRLDFVKGNISSTGIFAVSSYPTAAKIYLNGELKGVTDTNITVPHGKYRIEIKKDGYTTWKREYVLKGELVVTIDATLFPLNPSLTPLTTLGVSSIVPIDKTDKSLIFSETGDEEKDGIYLFDQSKRAFSFLPPLKLIALKKLFSTDILFTDVRAVFSPDYKQAIIQFRTQEDEESVYSYLIVTEDENTQVFDVTASSESLMEAWRQEREKETARFFEILPKEFSKVASDSFRLVSFSPDKTKVLYQCIKELELPVIIKPPLVVANQAQEQRALSAGMYYVYDRKEDKNYAVTVESDKDNNERELPVQWYSTSRHFVVNQGNQISVMEYDGSSRQIVYSGPHVGTYFDVTSDGRLLILANLNPEFNKFPDVYVVGIR